MAGLGLAAVSSTQARPQRDRKGLTASTVCSCTKDNAGATKDYWISNPGSDQLQQDTEMSHRKLAKYLKAKTKRLLGFDKEIAPEITGRTPRDDQQNGLYAALVEEQETKERIRRSLECPICTDILLDPIILECGHTFCLHCFAHDCDRRNSATLVCCLCRDNTSKAVITARSLRDVIQTAFPSEEIHRRATLTIPDRQAVCRLLAAQQKSSIRQTLNRHLTRIKYASAGLIIFLAWFFYPELP